MNRSKKQQIAGAVYRFGAQGSQNQHSCAQPGRAE